MYTKEKLYRRRARKKSIKGWIYSFAAALFLILMAVILLAAKRPENRISGGIRDMKAGDMQQTSLEAGGAQRAERAAGEMEGPEEAFDNIEEENSMNRERDEEKETYVPLIVLDAGHGGMDSGCLDDRRKVMEKDINLQIAFLVRDRLEEDGYRVIMTREADEMLSKEERVELANSHQADVYVSIHQNTYEGKDKSVGGIETWYDGADETKGSKALAASVHREAVKSTGAVERSLIDSNELYVLSKTSMPACLIETGFLSNTEECKKLSDAEYQKKLAEGIAGGITAYLKENKMK